MEGDNAKKTIIIGGAVLATAALGFLTYKLISGGTKRKPIKDDEEDEDFEEEYEEIDDELLDLDDEYDDFDEEDRHRHGHHRYDD